MTKTEIKNLLEKYGIKPNQRLGQNFLIDQNILNKIIEIAEVSKKDTVLEIGAGLGNLTQKLSQSAKKVIAVEKDKHLIEPLKKVLKDYKNIEIIQGDILKIPKSKLQNPKNYKAVANLPYYITSPLIRMFLEAENQPREMTLLIQKEVAQRITAKPPRMNILAVSVQFYANPKIISYVSKNCFWPKPKIDSAIIKITNIKKPEKIDVEKFFQIVKAGFSSPRKQLINNLSAKLKIGKEEIKKALTQCELSAQVRAQSLNLDDWKNLSSQLYSS